MSRILGVGELLWDVKPSSRTPGGAPYNFVFHCRQLGRDAAILSRVGDDPLGRELLESVRACGITDQSIQIDEHFPTGEAVVHGEGAGYTITPDVAWDWLRFDARWITEAPIDAVCFGTLAQRHPASRRAIWTLLEQLPDDTLVVCDLNVRPPMWTSEVVEDSLHRADWLKINESEREMLFRWLGVKSVEALRRVFDLELVCVTLGAAGCLVQTESEEVREPGIAAKPGGDSVGAGDAFTAALVCRTLDGEDIAAATRFANRYAALVAGRIGGTPRIERAEFIG